MRKLAPTRNKRLIFPILPASFQDRQVCYLLATIYQRLGRMRWQRSTPKMVYPAEK